MVACAAVSFHAGSMEPVFVADDLTEDEWYWKRKRPGSAAAVEEKHGKEN